MHLSRRTFHLFLGAVALGGLRSSVPAYAEDSEATARGYDCLTFDGPGQGYALWKQKLYFRPDWENEHFHIRDTDQSYDPRGDTLYIESGRIMSLIA